MKQVIGEVKPEKIWIHSSSIGCQVACDAFEHMHKDADFSDAETEIQHVIMAAPDVGDDEFNARFKNEISALTKNLTTYVSSNDEALLLSSIIDNEKKLGRQKLKKHQQLEETKDILYLKSLSPDRIALVDVTPINTASFRHGYYLESPEYFDDVYMRIFRDDLHVDNRRLYLIEFENGTDHWILRRGD